MGRTLEEMWQLTWASLRAAGVAEERQRDFRAVFYGGCAAVLEESTYMASQGATTQQISAHCFGWHGEIVAERRRVIEEYARRTGGLKPGEQN